jgi:hypothetical protein
MLTHAGFETIGELTSHADGRENYAREARLEEAYKGEFCAPAAP